MRRLAPLAVLLLTLGACTSEAPRQAPATNRSPETMVSTIPRAPAQPRSDAGEDGALDLDAIAARGRIRILVARSGTHFYPSEGGYAGKTVDAAVALSKVLSGRAGKSVTPVFIETHERDLIPHLLAGKGDVVANLLLTFERDDQVAFAPPIRADIRELVVTQETKPLISLEDVGTRTIAVREGSDHHASLLRLNEQLKKIDRAPARIELALPPITDEQLMERVNSGVIHATLVDDYVFQRVRGSLSNIAANPDIAVSQGGSLSWVTRKDAPKLIAFLKDFFSTHRLAF